MESSVVVCRSLHPNFWNVSLVQRNNENTIPHSPHFKKEINLMQESKATVTTCFLFYHCFLFVSFVRWASHSPLALYIHSIFLTGRTNMKYTGIPVAQMPSPINVSIGAAMVPMMIKNIHDSMKNIAMNRFVCKTARGKHFYILQANK